jgi:hypothetical protein
MVDYSNDEDVPDDDDDGYDDEDENINPLDDIAHTKDEKTIYCSTMNVDKGCKK